MYFANSHYIYLLFLLIPLAVLLQFGHIQRRKNQRKFADLGLLKPLKPNTSTAHRFFRNILLLISLAFIILALARPQLQLKKEVPESEKGIECMFVVDISNSMRTEDIKPNRLEFAKLTMQRMISKLKSSRIGIVVFAGSSFIHLPITTDLAEVRNHINECDPTMISNQGTAMAPAISLASQSFSSKKDIGKAIVLFTDGEEHQDGALDAAKEATKKGAKLFTVMVGTTEGGLIPFEGNYIKDEKGETVVSKANLELCKELAKSGDGIAFSSRNISTLSQYILDELEKLPQASMEGKANEYEELYGQFLWIAVILMILSQFIFFKKNRLFSRLKIFDR